MVPIHSKPLAVLAHCPTLDWLDDIPIMAVIVVRLDKCEIQESEDKIVIATRNSDENCNKE